MAADMKPSEALRKARELITPEGAWTQGDLAKSSSGSGVPEFSSDAVCWCAVGALWAVYRNGALSETCEFLRSGIATIRPLGDWNDAPGRTHAEVLDAFRRAEALAIAEGR